jgi:magnesium transporter
MTAKAKTTRRRIARPHINPGVAPGSLSAVHGSTSARVTLFTIAQGSPAAAQVSPAAPQPLKSLSDLPASGTAQCHWVRVIGLGDLEPLRTICDFYSIQSMTLEDILSPGWRSKLEHSGDFLFLVLQAPPDNTPKARNEHLFLLYKPGLIITFEDTATTLIDTLWQRLASATTVSGYKNVGAYITYAILDLIIDRFFPLLYKKDETLAELEDIISIRIPTREEMNRLYTIKRDLLTLRRLLTPYHELESLFRQAHLDKKYTELAPYLSDLRDHITQAAELVDAYHDITGSLNDIYQSALTNRMNDIIKVLTIISTIFIPLTFIAGVYGMNFHNMPELETTYGYPIVLSGMLAVVLGMLWFFHKKKWL